MFGRFFRGKMIQYLPDNHWIFHTGNNLDWPLTLLAGFDINIEYPLQSLSPTHRNMALSEAGEYRLGTAWIVEAFSSSLNMARSVFEERRQAG